MVREDVVDEVTRQVTAKFRTFGRGSGSQSFLGKCLADAETGFATGVSVREVVAFAVEASAVLAPSDDALPSAADVGRRLDALGLELRRFDDALAVVGQLRGMHGPSGDAARWVADAAVTEGARTVRHAIEGTLRDLVILAHGTVPPAEAGLGALLDAARGGDCRDTVLPGEVTFDLRMLGDALPERAGGDLRFDSHGLTDVGEKVADAGHRYVRAARRALLLSVAQPATEWGEAAPACS